MKIDLWHGDCLELMKNIPDNSIDLVLTDPPYRKTACAWDVVIPFEPMWEQLKRITKERSAICLFGSEPFSSHLRLSNLKMFKYDWIWNKRAPKGHLNAKKMPLSQHEVISVFYTDQPTYIPILHQNKLRREFIGNSKKDETQVYGKQKIHQKNISPTVSYPRSIIEQVAVIGNSKEKVAHPTQKPVALLEYLIKTYTLEGETVLDFTAGSFSTGVACVNTNRNFIGIEKDDHYFNIGKKRVEDVLNAKIQK